MLAAPVERPALDAEPNCKSLTWFMSERLSREKNARSAEDRPSNRRHHRRSSHDDT